MLSLHWVSRTSSWLSWNQKETELHRFQWNQVSNDIWKFGRARKICKILPIGSKCLGGHQKHFFTFFNGGPLHQQWCWAAADSFIIVNYLLGFKYIYIYIDLLHKGSLELNDSFLRRKLHLIDAFLRRIIIDTLLTNSCAVFRHILMQNGPGNCTFMKHSWAGFLKSPYWRIQAQETDKNGWFVFHTLKT